MPGLVHITVKQSDKIKIIIVQTVMMLVLINIVLNVEHHLDFGEI